MEILDLFAKQDRTDSVILDTRYRTNFMAGHIKNSLLATIDHQFNTIAGSYVKENQDIYLIIEEDKVEEAVVDLVRIGLDNIVGYATPDELINSGLSLTTTKTIRFDEVDELMETGSYNLLDTRKKSEFDEGHHPEAINIAHTRLLARLEEIPTDKPLIVHCKSGNRASFASALLETAGWEVLYVNDQVEPWLMKNDLLVESH